VASTPKVRFTTFSTVSEPESFKKSSCCDRNLALKPALASQGSRLRGYAIPGDVIISVAVIVKFSELVRLLVENGFKTVKEKGSVRYYAKDGWERIIRVDYHGSKEVPRGTCNAILKAAGIKGQDRNR